MTSLSKQWGDEARKSHDLVNNFSSNSQLSSAVGTGEMNNLRSAQELSSRINGELSLGAKAFGTGASVGYGISSSANDSLSKDLSEYKRLSETLSNSSNQEIRDAFSSSSSLSSTTNQISQEMVATSQALVDTKSNQSSINSNYSNDFNKYIREQGYHPNNLNVSEQTQLANSFVDDKLNNTYGITSHLNSPTSSLNVAPQTYKVDSAGLQQPSKMTESDSKKTSEFEKVAEEYKNHPVNTITDQASKVNQVPAIKNGVKNLVK